MARTRQLAKQVLSTIIPSSKLMMRGPKALDAQKSGQQPKQVALTFDDGPHPQHTPAILNQLAEYDITATFFVIGEKVEHYPHIVERILEEGHGIGNHTYSHGEPAETSCRLFHEEIRKTDQLLQQFTSQSCHLFRPPKGELTISKLVSLLWSKRTTVLWSLDSLDLRRKDLNELIGWSQQTIPENGDIVLLHDRNGIVVDSIEYIADWKITHNVEFVRISDWLRQDVNKAECNQQLQGEKIQA